MGTRHKENETGQCYNISNVAIKEFTGANYLTLTKYSAVIKANKLNITRQDDVPDNIRQLKVQFPPDGINYVQSYLSRNKCHSKVMYSDRKIVKVSEGGLTQLKTLNNCAPSLKENRMKISRKNLQTLMMMTSLSSSYC